MRRKFFLMMVASITVVLVVSARAQMQDHSWAEKPRNYSDQTYQPTVYEIDRLKDAMIVLNHDQYPNPDLVMPGQLVKVPSEGYEMGDVLLAYYTYTVLPSDTVGRVNCFWRIAERHLIWLHEIQSVAQVVPTVLAPDSAQQDQVKVDSVQSKNEPLWVALWFVLAIIGVLALMYLLEKLRKDSAAQTQVEREAERAREEDPANYPSVMPAPMSDDPTTAAGQIQHFYGEHPTNMDRGYYERTAEAPEFVLHNMAFGDGQHRPGRLHAEYGTRRGDRLYRGTMPAGEIRHALIRCGNLGTEVLNIPQGWTWHSEATADTRPQPQPEAPQHQETIVTPPATPETDEQKSVSLTIDSDDDGQAKLTVTATGNMSVMPTSFKRTADGSIEILFPRKGEKK